MLKHLKKQAGFTLLELLIVIVIIGILALIIVPGLASGPARARDAQRKGDLRTVKNALETYFNDNNYYPLTQTYGTTTTGLGDILHGTTDADYLKSWPVDPKNSGVYVYTYTSTAGSCTTGACSYTLKARLENTKDSQADANGDYSVSNSQ